MIRVGDYFAISASSSLLTRLIEVSLAPAPVFNAVSSERGFED